MDSIISKLIQADKIARSMVEQAQEDYNNTLSTIDTEKLRFKQNYKEKASRRIGIVRSNETAGSEESISVIDHDFKLALENLEEKYNQKHLEWEDELFLRVVEG